MKLVIDKAPLVAALNRAGAISARGTPILECLRLTTTFGKDGPCLEIVAHGYGRTFVEVVPLVDPEQGCVCVSAEKIRTFVGALPDGAQVAMHTEARATGGVALHVRAGRARATMDTLPPDGFPAVDHAPHGMATVEILAATLARALDRVRGSMAKDMTRAYLCGVHAHVLGDQLAWVATDGRRMARAVTAGTVPIEGSPILTPETADAVLGMCKGSSDETIVVGFPPGRVEFLSARWRLAAQLLTATFPDYRRAIPAVEPDGRVEVDGDLLRNSLARVIPFAVTAQKGTSNVLSLLGAEGVLKISSPAGGIDGAEDEVECYVEGKVDAGVNARQLLDLVGTMGSGPVELAFVASGGGGFVRVRNMAEDPVEFSLTMMAFR